MLVSPKKGESGVPAFNDACAAVSNERTDVVPTATTRPPRARVALIFSITSKGTSAYSLCIW